MVVRLFLLTIREQLSDYQPAIDLLKANIAHLPVAGQDFSTVTLLPFAVEGEEVDALRDLVCRAIVQLFADSGYPMDLTATAPAEPVRSVHLSCRQCSTPLITATVNDDGNALIPAAQVIQGIAQRLPECPHNIVTPEDHRRRLEAAIQEEMQ